MQIFFTEALTFIFVSFLRVTLSTYTGTQSDHA